MFFVNLPIGLAAWLVGSSALPSVRDDTSASSPDYPGVALLAVSLAALVLAISEGPDWGWTSLRVVGAVVVFLGAGAAFLRALFPSLTASARPHPFVTRSFSVANTAALLFYWLLLPCCSGTSCS